MLEQERIQSQLKAVARVISCELERVKDALHFLACNSRELFNATPDDPGLVDAWLRDKGFGVGEDGFFLSLPDLDAFRASRLRKDSLSYSWPPDKADDPDARFRLFSHRNMGPMLMTLHDRLPGAVWIYYQDVTNTALQYPYIDQITAITPDFQWAGYHTYASVEPGANPERETCWAAPHVDYAGQGLIIAASVPLYVDDEFTGLWSVDLHVDSLVRPSVLAPMRRSQLTCVVQGDGSVVSSSGGVLCEGMAKGEVAAKPFKDLHTAFADIDLMELRALRSGYRQVEAQGEEYQVHWVNLHCLDWVCVTVLSRADLMDVARGHFREAFESLGRGELEAAVVVEKLPIEMLDMGRAYNEMVGNLHKARKNLLQQQEELRLAKARAEAANRAKTLFLANMSHELRTPLNGIVGMHQLLRMTELSAEQEKYVGVAVQSAHRLTGLLGDILDLTRVEAGKLSLTEKPFDLAEALTFIEQLFASSCRQKGIACNFHIHEGVPRRLTGDVIRLQQVLNNLVGNAIKFTDRGEVLVEAYPLPGGREGGCRVLFSVSDTGIGIDEGDMDKLFEPFTQADPGYTRSYQGAGLGLSIVRRLAALMGGEVEMASRPGEGTVFHFCLPFGLQKEAARVEQPAGPLEVHIPTASTILLVEDDPISRMAAKTYLEKAGYRAEVAEDGAKALEALKLDDYGLVLMDVQMPVMNGIEAARAIRSGKAGRRKARIPIVALTAYAMPGDQDAFLEAGMNDCLVKPLRYEQLAAMVGKWLGGG